MTLRRLIIRLRVFFTLLMVAVAISGISALVYFHEKGFSDDAADRIAKEMERYGIYAEFDNLSFHLIRGLTANNVRFYHTENRLAQIAELPSLIIHVDKTKMMRGKLKINTVSISNAQLTIPLVKGEPDSPIINIANVSGEIDLPGSQSLSTTDLTGEYEGIQITLSCNVWRDAPKEKIVPSPANKAKQIKNYQAFREQLEHWKWPEQSSPQLKLYIEGNLSNPNKVDFDFSFSSESIEYESYKMENILIEGDWNQNLITLDQLEFSHQSEKCSITTDYDILKRNGRFKVDSSIHLQSFAKQVFGKQILNNFSAAGDTNISAHGQYQLPKSEQEKLDLSMIGNVRLNDFSFRGASINSLYSEFSWNNGDLYLDQLRVSHDQGKLSGRLIIKDRLIRYQTKSSLPANIYFPFIKSEKIKGILGLLDFTDKSFIDVQANGSINQDNLLDWKSHGFAEIRNFSHNGVPVSYIKGNYKLDRETANFANITATFDYSDYSLRKSFDGPRSGTLTAKSFDFNWAKKSVLIERLRGSAWPAPVMRLFSPKIANHIESYKFHLPPTVSCAGKICWSSDKSNDMRFVVGLNSTGQTDYNFLKEDLPLKNIKGQVTILPNKVQVNSLAGKLFDGNISGYLHVTPSSSAYSGRFQWDKLKLRGISQTYDIKALDKGTLTGSFTFRGTGSKVSTLNGHGNIALANGDLFAVPLFGPLSSLIDGVINPLNNQQVLHEQARNFSCNFSTKNGVFYSKDLNSMTQSTTFTGEGWIDIKQEILDITIRMNFRGMMGLAEVPMKVIELPFQALKTLFTGKEVKGLRQFRGSGKITQPSWKFAPFQPPRDSKNDPIFRTPPRAQVVQ